MERTGTSIEIYMIFLNKVERVTDLFCLRFYFDNNAAGYNFLNQEML